MSCIESPAFMCIRLNLLYVVIFNANNLLKRFYSLKASVGYTYVYRVAAQCLMRGVMFVCLVKKQYSADPYY